MGIIYKDKDHELNYNFLLQLMTRITSTRKAVAYLLALEPLCFEHCRELYDFHEDNTIPEGLDKAWHTSASRRTTRLAFNLYNGYFSDGETYIGEKPISALTALKKCCRADFTRLIPFSAVRMLRIMWKLLK